MARLIVFTDLDGTLLDHSTYKWEAAQPALRQLRLSGSPVVLCTSKTRAEVLPLRDQLKLTDPFVTENGGAIYIPRNYFPFALPTAQVEAGYQVLELGQRYTNLVRALEEAAETSGVKVRGFSHMKSPSSAASSATAPAAPASASSTSPSCSRRARRGRRTASSAGSSSAACAGARADASCT